MDPTVKKQSSSSDGTIRAVRAAIRLLALMIFLGILVLFVMMPTNTYKKKWFVQVVATTDSTYFGRQGATILIYTFPVLFSAVLGCAYLHLGKKLNNNKSKSSPKDRLAVLKRPVLVKGPLGIVSMIEMLFLVMFIALLVWSIYTYLRTGFQGIEDKAAKKGEKLWVSKLGAAALRLALTGNIALAFLFFPVARGSSILPLIGLTSEASIKYHIWLGHTCLTLFTTHGVCFIIRWIAKDSIWKQIREWDRTGVSILAGEISLVGGLVMWVTTFPRIRRKKFELFFYTHYLYIIFMLFFILHVGITYAFISLPSFYLFLVDRYLRFLQSQRKVRLISARVLPCETVELNFSKTPGLQYSPMSILFVNLPSVSKLQWHPFTVTSNSNLEQDKLSVTIKGDGSWSKKLYQMLSSSSSVDHLEASIEGPYGPVSTNFLGHDTLVMVSGGSGITPFISVIRELIFSSSVLKIKTPKILLISSFKSSSDLTMLDLILPISGGPLDLSGLRLQVEAYVTREKEPATENVKPLQALWFKPKATDAPASAILGPNSWLWLGAVISSSFVIFLVLMGLLTRYYIYPIDHNTGLDYPTSAQAAFNILLMCVSIAITASGAVLWNKKQNTMEARQVQNMEGSSAYGSPASFYNSDKELESLPRQSLIQSTKVHYGERPDLKRILFDCKGKKVGVLASGPKKMRHEVATICSSGLADNLHFESISFSW
ncbi:hypothetical protein VitviT2T_023845 [Vitis vinifera]|eukprot:XP_019081213.1 PREDICTED: ferric reduction oxidase 2 isoform X1 [Vitis vinifera]